MVNARQGCCSWHGGVCTYQCPCGGIGYMCCDGSALSATCAPYYPSCKPCPPKTPPAPKCETKTDKATEEIPFEKRTEPDKNLKKGETYIKQAGKNGQKEISYKITVCDGKETGREVVSENIIEQPTPEIAVIGAKEGCFIATAVYGTPTAENLYVLRKFRDEKLLTNSFGVKFVDAYYTYSPSLANYIAQHPTLKYLIKETQIDPLVWVINRLE